MDYDSKRLKPEKVEAICLRIRGCSYNEILKKTGVPKGTLSGWFKQMGFSNTVKEKNIARSKKIWAQNIAQYNRKRSAICRAKWNEIQASAYKEIGKLSKRELLLVGSAIYWAEGFKKTNYNLVFCNSDPKMVLLALQFFNKICGVPYNKIKAQVQIHKNISNSEAIKYWLNLTRIPKEQFNKSIFQVSKGSKGKRGNVLPYGTFRLRVNDVKLVNRIKGWISGLAAAYK